MSSLSRAEFLDLYVRLQRRGTDAHTLALMYRCMGRPHDYFYHLTVAIDWNDKAIQLWYRWQEHVNNQGTSP